MTRRYADRRAAGRALADELRSRGLHDTEPRGRGLHDTEPLDALVLALPRGGVPVAAEVAEALQAELDVVVARKIGAPGRPEWGVGAVAESGPPLFEQRSLDRLGLTPEDLAATVHAEQAEARRRLTRYRGNRPAPRVEGRLVVVVDDGMATGVTARAALGALAARHPGRLLLAVPVCPPGAERAVEAPAELVCPYQPSAFRAVGDAYDDFTQLSDDDVLAVLEEAGQRRHPGDV